MVHIPGLDNGENLSADAYRTIGAAAAEIADAPPPSRTPQPGPA